MKAPTSFTLAIASVLILFAVRTYGQTSGFDWITSAGGSGNENITKISVDQNGSCFVVGTFGDIFGTNITFGTERLAGTRDSSVFVAKYLANGSLAWATKLGGECCLDNARGIAVDETGASYVAGSLAGEIFTAKHNGSGRLQWLATRPGAARAEGIFLSGSDLYTLKATNNLFAGNISVLKYNRAGVFEWEREVLNGLGFSNSLGCDQEGNIYVAGSFAGTAKIGRQLVTSQPYPTDQFVSRSIRQQWDS